MPTEKKTEPTEVTPHNYRIELTKGQLAALKTAARLSHSRIDDFVDDILTTVANDRSLTDRLIPQYKLRLSRRFTQHGTKEQCTKDLAELTDLMLTAARHYAATPQSGNDATKAAIRKNDIGKISQSERNLIIKQGVKYLITSEKCVNAIQGTLSRSSAQTSSINRKETND